MYRYISPRSVTLFIARCKDKRKLGDFTLPWIQSLGFIRVEDLEFRVHGFESVDWLKTQPVWLLYPFGASSWNRGLFS